MNKEDSPVLYAFSPAVVPRPSDWRKGCSITGYWFLDKPDWIPPQTLLDFIQAASPPVYIGFGSMSERDPQALSELLIRALRLAGQRGVLLSGWADLPKENMPDDMYVIESVPHDWLFPRMAAVVHHGGAGTTAAVFRAGVPNIAVPFFGDQNFWAGQVWRLGTGPRPIPRKRLTAENLAQAIKQAVSSAPIQQRAEALGEEIRREDGVARAIEILERNLYKRL
jgi:sterol 3beta-glucosyltransferase